MIRENIKDISELGSALSFFQNLKVSSFNYGRVIDSFAVEEKMDKTTGAFTPFREETYVTYPEGIQVMIEPNSLELLYPESVITQEDGSKYYRSDIITALLVQAVKELYEEISKLTKLEKK
jgi:hypothetical protein